MFTAPDGTDELSALNGPLVYLHGPIQGSVNWHEQAINVLGDLAPEVHVASARGADFRGGPERHLAWEQAFMERAALDGVLVFWCAKETRHRCDRTHAAQMRFDLGEWAVKSSIGLARMVVGFERGFTGGPYLQRRFTLSYKNVPICRTLPQACAVAVEMAQRETPLVVFPRTLADLFVPQAFSFKNNG